VTPEAEELFPKAHEAVLRLLLDVLAEWLGPEGSERQCSGRWSTAWPKDKLL
jgi:hypothetical protein